MVEGFYSIHSLPGRAKCPGEPSGPEMVPSACPGGQTLRTSKSERDEGQADTRR